MEINDVALRFLHHRMRCEKEMREHLEKKGFQIEDIDREIINLKEFSYIDDVRYTTAYIRYGLGKRKALFRIKMELRDKGINQMDMEDGVYNFESEMEGNIHEIEIENAMIEAEKIIGSELDRKKLDKVARRLNSLGYSVSMITSTLTKSKDRNYNE